MEKHIDQYIPLYYNFIDFKNLTEYAYSICNEMMGYGIP